ncbi:MAG TPA: LytR C-terminal domain-containing protein [Gemmatimonadota bacterium]|nr:LytR C-terminal domain-containing protein [Gemmatimonadota bacterium]
MLRRAVGCLQTVGIAVFALVIGAFSASTVMRHLDRPRPAEVEPGAADSVPPLSRARIRIEVRNGSGTAGAAERVTEILRRRGFDVVDFGNADRFDYERTVVLDRIGRPEYAREVAAAFQGLPIESAPDSSLYLDVTVRIGRDLEEVLDPADQEAAEGEGWRRWLRRIPGLDRLR